MSINLAFGNPNREFLKILKEENYLDSLLTELKNYPHPAYDSPQQEQEIAQLVSVADVQLDPKTEERFMYYDTDFEKYIVNVLVNSGVSKSEVEDIISQIRKDITPLLYKLKYHYQRIRPLQLALYFNSPLYPYLSKTAVTPSYPSGHCFESKVYCEVLGNRYPKFYQSLQQLTEDISVSRMYMGLHYQSDIEFAKYCADLVMNHPDFKKKFKL
jgi:hypothetical protein